MQMEKDVCYNEGKLKKKNSTFEDTAKKILEIEQKLEKYRQIKTKHELIALEDRKREIEENRRLVDEHRLFSVNKIRTNH